LNYATFPQGEKQRCSPSDLQRAAAVLASREHG